LKLTIYKGRLIISVIFLIVLSVTITTCRYAGSWLVKNNTPNHVDAMVILMGSIPDRVLQATDLYKIGVSDKVLIVEESMGAYQALEARGAHIISNTMQAHNALISLGIPAESITILPGDAHSTQQESLIVREYLSENPGIHTLLLVTSAEHTRRASIIFDNAFRKNGLQVKIFSSPSKYTGFRAAGWWKHKEEIQAVLGEYVKLINFWIFDRQRL
jgi:uncharacterized SAM-binding protein YcdF (DUF218 family)